MALDLNTLPPSRSNSSSPHQTRTFPPATSSDPDSREAPSPRSASTSLAAAASINAADLSRHSSNSPRMGRAHERRRSAVAINLNLNDPTMPSPGELSSSDHRSYLGNSFRTTSPTMLGGTTAISTGDPHHNRTPSLGEIHQELEQEQEARVNCLLQQIRIRQAQLLQQYVYTHGATALGLLSNHGSSHPVPIPSSTAIDDSTPPSEHSSFQNSVASSSILPAQPTPITTSNLPRRQPSNPYHSQTSPSPSPALRPSTRPLHHHQHDSSFSSTSDFPSPSSEIPSAHPGLVRRTSRDEAAFYQAETANLTRENQMLRLRIRELERMVGEGGGNTHHQQQHHKPPQ